MFKLTEVDEQRQLILDANAKEALRLSLANVLTEEPLIVHEQIVLEAPVNQQSVYERKQAKLMAIILRQQKQLTDMMDKIKVIDGATSHIMPIIITPKTE